MGVEITQASQKRNRILLNCMVLNQFYTEHDIAEGGAIRFRKSIVDDSGGC